MMLSSEVGDYSRFSSDWAERVQVEEEMMQRLPLTKQDKKKMKSIERDSYHAFVADDVEELDDIVKAINAKEKWKAQLMNDELQQFRQEKAMAAAAASSASSPSSSFSQSSRGGSRASKRGEGRGSNNSSRLIHDRDHQGRRGIKRKARPGEESWANGDHGRRRSAGGDDDGDNLLDFRKRFRQQQMMTRGGRGGTRGGRGPGGARGRGRGGGVGRGGRVRGGFSTSFSFHRPSPAARGGGGGARRNRGPRRGRRI